MAARQKQGTEGGDLPLTITLAHVRAALARPLPGLRGQLRMVPSYRFDFDLYAKGAVDCRRAAVLFLLYPHDGQLTTLLTVRPSHLPDHPGQVSFPGGARDAEELVVETALREAQEEVGLDPALVQPLGRLTHIYIPPSHFCIQILVGYAAQRPCFRPNPHEVAQILETPLAHFFGPANVGYEPRLVNGVEHTVPYFAIGPHRVWGATAIAIAELITAIEEGV